MSLPASDISSASHLVSPYKWLLEKDKRRKNTRTHPYVCRAIVAVSLYFQEYVTRFLSFSFFGFSMTNFL